MSAAELTDEQAAAVAELEQAITTFAAALQAIRASGLRTVEGFRLAGIEVPSFVPDSVLESLLGGD